MASECALIVVQTDGCNRAERSIDVDQGAAIDRERDPGNEIRLIGCEKERCVGHVPSRTHLMAQRHSRIAGGRHLGTAFSARAGAGIDGHGRIHQSRQNDVGANPELRVLDGDLL